jgi:single-strand DNA-binding protein
MFQELIIVGNVGKDPEMRYTPSGQAVTSFSVATNRTYKDAAGEQIKETTWFRVSAWGKTGEAVNSYVHKGSKVLVTGRLNADPATGGPRIWQAQDGSARASFEITASTVRFLNSKSDDEARGEAGEATAEVGAPTEAGAEAPAGEGADW